MHEKRSTIFMMLAVVLFGFLYCHNVAAAASLPLSSEIGPYALEDRIRRMTLEEKIGQLFIISADGDLENLIQNYHVGGIVLFTRHAPNISQTMQLIEKVRRASALPLFIAVDQEGGPVSRLSFATTMPAARNLGMISDSSMQKMGLLVGRELQSLGFNMNFAPVLDVDTCEENPVIGKRSFSRDPYTVARLGSAYIRGLHSAGIAAVGKHFPGHGDTRTDSHFELPVVFQSEERLQTLELLPFRAAIASGVDAIMMAHVSYPALDPTPNWPASLSRAIITETLRSELEYAGIVITDAMNMKAITDLKTSGLAAKAAFQAGADIILMPAHFPVAYHMLLTSVQNGEISVSRLDASVRRILSLKIRLPDHQSIPFDKRLDHALKTVGSPAHRLWLERLMNERKP
ncbi:MAG: beta-N-acetylhexosaminidase [Negativicutes bacterium]